MHTRMTVNGSDSHPQLSQISIILYIYVELKSLYKILCYLEGHVIWVGRFSTSSIPCFLFQYRNSHVSTKLLNIRRAPHDWIYCGMFHFYFHLTGTLGPSQSQTLMATWANLVQLAILCYVAGHWVLPTESRSRIVNIFLVQGHTQYRVALPRIFFDVSCNASSSSVIRLTCRGRTRWWRGRQ